jgi:hypothetical protein
VLSACPAKTTQNANLALSVSNPPQFRRPLPSSRSSPFVIVAQATTLRRGYATSRGFMVCYQVLAQFTFHQHKPALVSTHIKKQHARPFLVRSGLPFGSGLKYRRFFKTKK